ncbi:hypothetical protein O181_020576 [Austropuccinia psidii MF-1]|uniref:Uncharacterized protein n=1 Tax=Austropuccinia psidii MF-1 TaxID=1389203 RepID=A0A9Q3CDR1_9BASI|nr:hypothetical protein [Austropuccinia psidii MF-1]
MLTIPYAFPGSQRFTRKYLCLYRFPTVQTTSYDREASNNSNTSLSWCRLPTLHMRILTLVQVPNSSHAHPYTCTGSQQSRQFLMPGQPPQNSKKSSNNLG